MPKQCKHPTCGETCRRPKKTARKGFISLPRAIKEEMGILPVPLLLKIAISELHKYVKLRDQKLGCISCTSGRVEEAGHYYPAGKFSGVRLDEVNVNGQCKGCNQILQGNLEGYYTGLLARYGGEAINDLESRANATKLYKWTRPELIELIEQTKIKSAALL